MITRTGPAPGAAPGGRPFTPCGGCRFRPRGAWGWVALILGLLQLLAGAGVMVGNQAARWAGIALIGLNLVNQMFFIPAYPFWALTIIAFDVFALYGLCVYGSRANVTGD